MAVLEKIRVKFGLAVSIIIALALLSFIIDPSTLQTVAETMSSKNNVGRIAGKNISYTDYQADVDKFTTINEIITGSSVQNEQTQKQIRDAAWQSFIDRFLFIKNAKAAGIKVGNDELVELTTGENASPVISQNPVFTDKNGVFSRDAVVEFVQSISSDETGHMKTYWDYIQNTVYTQQYYAKYGSLFSASNYLNALQRDYEVAANNTKANVDYVVADYGFQNDTTINISSAEIKKYYEAHKDFFKQIANRDAEYVVFEVVPSEADIAQTSDKMNTAHSEFAVADNLKAFLLKNSERQLSDYWYKSGELKTVNSDIDAFIFGDGKGVSPIIRSGNTFYAAKVAETAMIPDSVYVKHILLQGANARHLADSLLDVVKKGADFAATAAVYSEDQASTADGEIGNIGWMTQSYMIPGFESVITSELNKPFILNTRYGTHVVVVTKKTTPIAKKRVAILEKTALASKETFNVFYSKANKFATLTAGKYEGYKKAVDSLGVYSHPLNVTEATENYGGIDNAKEVTRWIFDNKAGKASNIITVNQNYFFIAAVKTIHKEGYKTVEEVSEGIRQTLYTQARAEKKKAEVKAQIEGLGTLEAIAEKLGTQVVNDEEISFATMVRSFDPAALGAMAVAPLNQISGPVAGARGVYVFKVNSRDTESFYTEEDAKNKNLQFSQYASNSILPVMMEDADVKDNRARFF